MPQKKSDVAEWLRRQTRIENECNDEREFFSSVGFSRVGSNPAVTGSFFFAIFCGAVALAFYCAYVRQIKNVLHLALALSRHEPSARRSACATLDVTASFAREAAGGLA